MSHRYFRSCFLAGICFLFIRTNYAQVKLDTRFWSQYYWLKMAKIGLVEVAPEVPAKKGVYTGSRINALSQDSPDVPITSDSTVHQSENSAFVHPLGSNTVLNSNNSTDWPVTTLYGTSAYFTTDGGSTWDGHKLLPSGSNWGDPAAVIGLKGWYYVGGISDGGGQEVNYSTDNGATWTKVQLPVEPGEFADKNHLWVDNSPMSPHEGNLYSAWTAFGGLNDSDIELDYSTDGGLSWNGPVNISSAVAAGSHNQGVNIQSGPNGEVYAVWSIYDSWPTDENAIGFAKSTDGGATWEPATRIIENIRGIRISRTSKNMRVNSFPVMAVDISSGSPNIGNICVVWANIGVPGVNVGPDIDVYMIKSTDGGNSWSSPIRVNQDSSGLGKEHYFPWITCDPEIGVLSVIFYDDRNVNSTDCEVFVATSLDGGNTWEDFKVSDVSFTPAPIPGLAGGYFGDYLGISARAGQVYPVWTSNYTGQPLAYVSPFYVINGDLVLQNITVGIGKTKTYRANNSITAAASGTYFTIEGNGVSGGNATFVAGNSITLNPGFTVDLGGSFYAYIDPGIGGGLGKLASSDMGGLVNSDIDNKNSADSTNSDGENSADSTNNANTSLPTKFTLSNNYPNPFNPTTSFKYALKEETKVTIKIYNILGKEITTLVSETQPAGYQSVVWHGTDNSGNPVPSGIYLCIMVAGDFTESQKMVLLK